MKRSFGSAVAVAFGTLLVSPVLQAQEAELAPATELAPAAPAPPAAPPAAAAETIVAQPEKTAAFGVKAGLDFAWVSGDEVNDSVVKSTLGFSGGAFLIYRLNQNLALQPELLFTMKGFETKGDPKATASLNYISAPVLLRATLPVQGKVRPYVFGGPEFAFNVSAKIKVSGQGTTDVKDSTNLFELSLNFGGGVEIQLANAQRLLVEFRYGLGLTTVDDSSSEDDIKNQVITLNGGYAF